MISLDDMAALARALLDAEEATKAAEENLKLVKEAERKLREETLPAALQELGVEKLKLDTGQTITVSQEVYCSIPKANKPRAFAWLVENNFGGLIKTQITVDFGKEEREKAAELYRELYDRNLQLSSKDDVHTQTLKAFIKEQLKKSEEFPLDLFGAQPVWTAKVKQAK